MERMTDTLDWLYSLEARGEIYKLDRMDAALALIGDPHRKLRAIHIAGTKGKGSVAAMLDDARGWRLAEMRKRRGMTQEQVAARMGVSVARVSQIESGDVSTQDVLSRFVAALGGTLKLIADFGDEQLKLA